MPAVATWLVHDDLCIYRIPAKTFRRAQRAGAILQCISCIDVDVDGEQKLREVWDGLLLRVRNGSVRRRE